MSDVFNTVLAGVFVYVLGQILMKLVVDPILDFRRFRGEVSAFFLRNQGVLFGASASERTQEDIFALASMLVQKREAIVFPSWLAYILFCLPRSEDALVAARRLNFIGNVAASREKQVQVWEAMKELETLLRIKVTYETPGPS